MGSVLLVVIAVLVWWMSAARPQAVPVSSLPAAGSSPAIDSTPAAPTSSTPGPGTGAPASGGSPSTALIVVDVAGRVVRPGIYRLPTGSRVFDAVQAAGGARPGVDLVSLNLAAPLQDGQQVVVGLPGATATQPGAASAGGGTAAPAIVDLNTATLEQLETLPGVGPVLGQHILDWRDAHQRFASIDQLTEVAGIGDVRFAQLKTLVSV
jgi:competence protein ComEA